MAKECIVLTVEVKKVFKLEADVAELQKTIIELHNIHQTKIERLCSIHQAEIERKYAFCESEKVRVLKELHASYNAKLPGLYAEQSEYGYWVGYDEAEQIAHRDPKPSSKDASKPTCNVNIVEPNRRGEARGWKEASGGGPSEPVIVVSIEPDVIIMSKIVVEPSTHFPKNSVDVARPSMPPKVDVVGPLVPPKDLVDVVGPSAPPP